MRKIVIIAPQYILESVERRNYGNFIPPFRMVWYKILTCKPATILHDNSGIHINFDLFFYLPVEHSVFIFLLAGNCIAKVTCVPTEKCYGIDVNTCSLPMKMSKVIEKVRTDSGTV